MKLIVAKTPIRVHWSILIWLPVCWLYVWSSIIGASIAFASICTLILIHELGHAAVARYCGLRVHELSFNAIHGNCVFSAPRHKVEHALVACGGVAAQLLLFTLAVGVMYGLSSTPHHWRDFLAPMFIVFTAYNVALAAVNLLPLAPMDGALAWHLLPAAVNGELRSYWRSRRRRYAIRP